MKCEKCDSNVGHLYRRKVRTPQGYKWKRICGECFDIIVLQIEEQEGLFKRIRRRLGFGKK